MRPNTLQSVLDRRVRDGNGCMIWPGAKRNGYGVVSLHNQSQLVHRLVYEHHYGAIPEGMFICHHCDVPACSEPTHLFIGTPRDNVVDAVSKGRHAKMAHTHCPSGHEYTPQNTRHRTWSDGRRSKVCVECYRRDQRGYRRAQRARDRLSSTNC